MMTVYRFNKETGKIEAKSDEHPAWVVPFSLPNIRSFQNGKHRRPSPKAHRDPAHGADSSTGRPVFSWSSVSNPNTFNLSPGAVNPVPSPFGKGLTLADYAKMLAMIPIIDTSNPKPPTLPYAGIRTGEIIGHRLWWVLPDGLYSIAHNFRWEPGATVEGKLDELLIHGMLSSKDIYGGVYAFASNGELLQNEYYQNALEISPPRSLARGHHPVNHAIGLVRGTVKLWGEVIEHEKGWRAQFAKLASIEEWVGDGFEVPRILQPYYDSLKEKP